MYHCYAISQVILCLAPWARKMNRISCCDWLPERARWSYLARSGYGLCPASTQIMLWCFIPYNKSFIDQASSVKMAGYWPHSCSFDKAKQHYEDVLKQCGHTTNFTYIANGTSTPQQSNPAHHRKNRQRKIIWFNPPYSRNVHTNVGKSLLGLITKHFPTSHKYHKIFNKNTIKVSYSCMDNMERIIKKHNQKILNADQTTTTHGCNCRKKLPAPWKTTVSLPASCTTLKLQQPKIP